MTTRDAGTTAGVGLVQGDDVHAAQTLIDAYVQALEGRVTGDVLSAEGALVLRGLLAAWSADVRTAGYLEGIQRGRREAAHVVLDALHGEGLAP